MNHIPPSPPPSSPPPGTSGSRGGETPAAWGADPPNARPRLTRSRDDRYIGGVCGGLAEHLRVDPTIVRIVAIALAFTAWGVLIYLIAWAALPTAEAGTGAPRPARAKGSCARRFPWLPAVIAINLLWIIPSFSWGMWEGNFGPPLVPLLLLAGVGYLLWRASHGEGPGPRRHAGPHQWHGGHRGHGGRGGNEEWNAPPPATTTVVAASSSLQTTSPPGVTAPADRPEWARPDGGDENSASPAEPFAPAGDAGKPVEPADADEDPLLVEARRLSDPFLTEPLLFETAPSPATAPAASPPERRRGGGRAALASLLIGAGVVWLAWALGVSMSPFLVLAGGLITIGVWLVFGGIRGRRVRGLIIPGLIVFGLLSIASAADLDVSGGAGERLYQPTTLAQVQRTYELGVGEMTIDLSQVAFGDEERTIDASIGAGELIVTVPDDVTVNVHAHAGLGEIQVFFAEPAEGFSADVDQTYRGSETGGELTLVLDVNLGQITVEGAGKPPVPPEPREAPRAPRAPD